MDISSVTSNCIVLSALDLVIQYLINISTHLIELTTDNQIQVCKMYLKLLLRRQALDQRS